MKALKAQHPDVRVFAVGDDWQSIFRFAGSDIHFDAPFRSGIWRQLRRARTGGAQGRRPWPHLPVGRPDRHCGQNLRAAEPGPDPEADRFRQGPRPNPPSRFVTVSKGEYEGETFRGSYHHCQPLWHRPRSLRQYYFSAVTGFVEPDLQDLRRRFPRLKIRLQRPSTLPKGLEADHVILLNADSGRTGFPSEDRSTTLCCLWCRRRRRRSRTPRNGASCMFAMTRARHTLTILASTPGHRATFVTELKQDSPLYASPLNWRGAGGTWLRRMRWAVVGGHREGRPHLVSLRACPALWKLAACLPVLRKRSAPPRGWNGRGSMWLRCHLSDVPRMRRWLVGQTQRKLWKFPWLRPLSDLRWEGENIER